MYLIEKNIPLAAKAGGRPRVYPFPQMKVGDSFYVNGGKTTGAVSAAACYHAKNRGGKFAVREEGKGVRCWRIK